MLEHEFEEETCGRDVGVYLCERATATNGGDDNDGQVVRWTWHLSMRSSIETSDGPKTFFHSWWRVLWSLRLIYVKKSGVGFDYDTGGLRNYVRTRAMRALPWSWSGFGSRFRML